MSSVNKTILVGHLGGAPEVRYLPDSTPTATISIATSDSWKDRETGEKKEKTEWHRVVFYRGLAEIVRDFLGKGSQIYIEGKLRNRKWTDNEGIERYTYEIVADEMRMLGKKPANETGTPPVRSAQSAGANDFEDSGDIPF